MKTLVCVLGLLLFPVSSQAPSTIEKITKKIQGYVDEEAIVGAELLVLKNRKVVFHQTFGWKDYEGDKKTPMEKNTLFNIRSMTKPIIGTAALILADEGKLSLDDKVSRYVPAFVKGEASKITVGHLITHRSGLPVGLMKGLYEYQDLSEAAAKAGERGPEFEPGTAFQYSDPGSDVLGAVVAKASGLSLDVFLQQRIFKPLGMKDTFALLKKGHPKMKRCASLFVGRKGAWLRMWKPFYPMYPFTLGSQSVYASPMDYGRFLSMWMDGGKGLLKKETATQALKPASEFVYPTGFPQLTTAYGQMWMLYLDKNKTLKVFGHNGSDGTFAWAWPKADLIVLYCTQSRGQDTGIQLEPLFHELSLN